MRRFKTTAVTTTALCALLGACAGIGKPQYPIADAGAAPAPAAVPAPPAPAPAPAPVAGDGAAPTAAPTAQIASAALPPPPGAREASASARPTTAYDAPAARPAATRPQPAQAVSPSQATLAMVLQKALGSGPVRTEPQKPIKVKRGETLAVIARQTGFDETDLARENGLKKPYRLKRGSTIRLPAKRYYLVQNGDTLYSIGRRFGLEAQDLAKFNRFKVSVPLRNGQKLYLPTDAKDTGVPKPVMVAAPSAKPPLAEAEATPSAPVPYAPSPASPPAPPPALAYARPPAAPARAVPAAPPPAPTEAAQPESAGDTEVAIAGRGLFQWPVRGEMISKFGPNGSARNDGVDLGATQGDSVRSAAAGEVVYAGNAVQGFGNLVLIKHDGGWVTAYAHLANIEVKMRQQVTQGQEIGLVGQTGGVDRPQLHFEVRYAPTPSDKARPIDPMLVLPGL